MRIPFTQNKQIFGLLCEIQCVCVCVCVSLVSLMVELEEAEEREVSEENDK